MTRLKKLFLVNNKINKIENISNLHQLQMLELGSNRIRVGACGQARCGLRRARRGRGSASVRARARTGDPASPPHTELTLPTHVVTRTRQRTQVHSAHGERRPQMPRSCACWPLFLARPPEVSASEQSRLAVA